MKTFNVAKSPKCQEEIRKILEAHELIYNLFLEFAKRSKTFDDNPAFIQSLHTALKLVRNKKITWTYGMFLKSTYDVFYLIDIFKELYTPEIQEKMDLVANYLTATIVVGGSERKKLFEALGEKENNPSPAYRKLDDVMWLQSLVQRHLGKVGASTSRDFLYKIHRYRKRRVLKRLKKKTKRMKVATESEDDAVETAHDDHEPSSLIDGESRSVIEDDVGLKKIQSKRIRDETDELRFSSSSHDHEEASSLNIKQKINELMAKVKQERDAEYESSSERMDVSAFEDALEDDDDDNDPLNVNKRIRTLETEMDLRREAPLDAFTSPGMSGEEAHDPLAPNRRNDPNIEIEDLKPDINLLNKRLKSVRDHDDFVLPASQESDPLDITCPTPEISEPEPTPPRRQSEMGESMASYIFSDSNMDIYSAKLADERRHSTSLSSMNNALIKIKCSPRPFGVIDSILSKLNSNVSLLGKMNKRNVLTDQTVVWDNEKIVSTNVDEQSRIDVILKLDPSLTKVGPINVYHKNRSFVYRCKIEECGNFYTLSLDLLQRHVLAQHVHCSFNSRSCDPFVDWRCSECGHLRVIDPGIRGVMKHLSDCHSLEATSQIAIGRLRSFNESILKEIQSVGECPVQKDPGNIAQSCQLFQCCVPSCTFSTDSSVQAINHFNIKLDGNAEFTCKYCSSIVTTAYEYAKHLAKQHGESQYKCGYCFYRGITKATIYFHQSLRHPLMVGKIFRCRIHAPFQESNASQEPKQAYHLIQLRCPYCRFNTTILDKFVRHLTDMHNYSGFKCYLCQEYLISAQRTEIIEHLLKHGIGEIQCLFCQQGFSTVTSAREHFSIDHPERYPFVILRHDYFGKSPIRSQFSRIKEIPLGFESLLGVDLGSDSVCENQLQVVDMSGTETLDYEEISKKFDYYFSPDRQLIILRDDLPRKPSPTAVVAQPAKSFDPKVKQTARKKTAPSTLKLVPLSKLIDEPKPVVTNLRVTDSTIRTSSGKETARKSTRPNHPTLPQFIPLAPPSSEKPQMPGLVTIKPSFTKPSTPVFKIKPNLGKVQSSYTSQMPQQQKKVSVINFRSPAVNPPVSQAGGAYAVKNITAGSAQAVRGLTGATPLPPKSTVGSVKIFPKSTAGSVQALTKSTAGSVQALTKSKAGSVQALTKSTAGSVQALTKSTVQMSATGSVGGVQMLAKSTAGSLQVLAKSPAASVQVFPMTSMGRQVFPKSLATAVPKKTPSYKPYLMKPPAPLIIKSSTDVKQTARKHTGGSSTFTPSPSTSKTPESQHVPSMLGSIDFKKVVRVINVSSRLPMEKPMTLFGKETRSPTVAQQISPGDPGNNPQRPTAVVQLPMTNRDITIVPLPPKPKRDVIALDSD